MTGLQVGKLATVLATSLLMPPGDHAQLQAMQQRAFVKRLDELGLLPVGTEDLHRSFRALGAGLCISVAMQGAQLKQLMNGNCVPENTPWLVVEWQEESMAGSEVRLRWQQLWRLLNLLLPLHRLWAGNVDMPGLQSLLDSPVLQKKADLPADWLEALETVADEAAPLCQALSAMGVGAPVVGFELLDGKQRVLAEAELAWPDLQVAVFLTESSQTMGIFEQQAWHCFVADGEALPEALTTLLMETLA